MRNNKKIIVRISALLTLVIMIGLGAKAIEVRRVMVAIDGQIAETHKQLKKEKEILQLLEEEKKQINSSEYVEKIAREKLGLVKADDIVVKEKKGNN